MGAGTAKRPKAGALRFIPRSVCSNTNEQGANRRPSPRHARGPKTIFLSAACSARFELAKSSINAGRRGREDCLSPERALAAQPPSSRTHSIGDGNHCRQRKPLEHTPRPTSSALVQLNLILVTWACSRYDLVRSSANVPFGADHVSALSDARLHEEEWRQGTLGDARSIKPSEGSRSGLRRTRVYAN